MNSIPVLQSCADYAVEGNYTDALANGSFMDAVTCPFANQVGGEVFALLVFATLGISLRIYTGSIIVPLVLAIIVGGAFMAQLTSGAVSILVIVLVLMVTLALFVLYLRMGRE